MPTGIYKTVDKIYVNIENVWKEVDEIYCNIGGIWKVTDTVFCNTDTTLELIPIYSNLVLPFSLPHILISATD